MKTFLKYLGLVVALLSGVQAQTVIAPGRAIEIQIKGVPAEEMQRVSGTYTVSESGLIRMPLLGGPIRAAGLSPTALAQNIEAAYRSAEIYTTPTINVIASTDETLAEYLVTIGGQVKRPGPVKYSRDMTVYQALQSGGGATEFGSMYRVSLIRRGKVTVLDLTDNKNKNLLVEPNDTIEVPQKNIFGR